jgi:hypothetical protein
MNQFRRTGVDALYSRTGIVLLSIGVLLFGFFVSKTITGVLLVVGVLGAIYFIHQVIKKPSLALTVMFALSFILLGLTRFVSAPFGLVIDVMICVTWVIIFFKGFNEADWSVKKSSLSICMSIWMLYNLLQLANPEMLSAEAWMYAVRGLALYSFLLIPLIFLIYNQKKDYERFIQVWFVASIIIGLYGAKQHLFGVYVFEQRWLDAGAGVQHVLWGRLRVFSFLSDAGQFGASQGQAGTVAIIFAVNEEDRKKKIFYWMTGFICLFGMAISGTRGAMFVPIGGFALYMLLCKDIKIMAIGGFVGVVLGYLLVFTMFMNSNATIARMRSAFDTKDASMSVRSVNRAMLDDYLISRPFGGGVGSAGFWGNRFTPGTFLADFQTDGQYIRIKAETGVVGLYIYLGTLLFILGNLIWITWNTKDPKLHQQIAALTCGCAGMMIANYGNAYTGQIPSNLVFFFCMSFVYLSKKWDKGEEHPVFGDVSHLRVKNDYSKVDEKLITLNKVFNKKK